MATTARIVIRENICPIRAEYVYYVLNAKDALEFQDNERQLLIHMCEQQVHRQEV